MCRAFTTTTVGRSTKSEDAGRRLRLGGARLEASPTAIALCVAAPEFGIYGFGAIRALDARRQKPTAKFGSKREIRTDPLPGIDRRGACADLETMTLEAALTSLLGLESSRAEITSDRVTTVVAGYLVGSGVETYRMQRTLIADFEQWAPKTDRAEQIVKLIKDGQEPIGG